MGNTYSLVPNLVKVRHVRFGLCFCSYSKIFEAEYLKIHNSGGWKVPQIIGPASREDS